MTFQEKIQSGSTGVLGAHPCVVYVIAASSDGPCKIGYSSNVQQRRDSLQTGNWMPLRVFGYRLCVFESGGTGYDSLNKSLNAAAKRLEAVVHNKLSELDVAITGEWFDLSVTDAFKAIEKCAALCGVKAIRFEDVVGADVDHIADKSVALVREKLTKYLAPINVYIAENQPTCIDDLTGKD